jgi:hypothetical protein
MPDPEDQKAADPAEHASLRDDTQTLINHVH